MKMKTEKKGDRWKCNTPTFGYHAVSEGQEGLVSGAREGFERRGGNNGKINERMKLTT